MVMGDISKILVDSISLRDLNWIVSEYHANLGLYFKSLIPSVNYVELC